METKNLAIISVAIIICVAIIAAAYVMVNNNSTDHVAVVNETNESSDSSVNETSSSSSDSSSAELGSRENPKTEIDYNTGHDGELNPNYGDYFVIDGGLFRDDNE